MQGLFSPSSAMIQPECFTSCRWNPLRSVNMASPLERIAPALLSKDATAVFEFLKGFHSNFNDADGCAVLAAPNPYVSFLPV